jgi:hypothetical protein
MYKIRSEAEDRTYECDLQFAVYGNCIYKADPLLYAASFTGRPSPVQAISAGLLMNIERRFTISWPKDDKRVLCDNVHVTTDRVGDVCHSIILPRETAREPVIVAPDGFPSSHIAAKNCSVLVF